MNIVHNYFNFIPDNGTVPPFEAFLHYAKIQRDAEEMDTRSNEEAEEQHWSGGIKRAFLARQSALPANSSISGGGGNENGEKHKSDHTVAIASNIDIEVPSRPFGQKDTAYMALKVASWQSIFYLIVSYQKSL